MVKSGFNGLNLEIPRRLNDARLDSALTTLLREKFPERKSLSRSAVTRAVNAGLILLNGEPAQARTLVATHDRLVIVRDVFSEEVLIQPPSASLAIEVLFEDGNILVLDKGAGVQMHRGGSHVGTTVAEWLLSRYPELLSVGEDPLRPGIVHRLDRDTSGVIIIAKNNQAFQVLKSMFQERRVEKSYVALVYGHVSSPEGKIDMSLMRLSGELKRRAIDPEHHLGPLPGNTRTALTLYRLVARYKEYDLLLVTPKTGRTHQIRVHLSSIGHPVVGDKLYAFKDVKRKKLLFPDRHLLHAARLAFTLFDKKYQFRSPLPLDFKEILGSIDETKVSGYDGEALKSLF